MIQHPILIPSWTEVADKIKNKRLYTVFDLKHGFYQVEIHEDPQKKCLFITPFRAYKFLRLPFGIKTASKYFQYVNQKNFEGITGVFCYIDDLVSADSEEEMDAVNQMVVERAKEKNFKFNPEKLQYEQGKVKYLGRIFSEEGVSCDPERTRALLELQPPSIKK